MRNDPAAARQKIASFLADHHVLTLCSTDGDDLWCANCFYVLDAEAMAFYVMTDAHSRHGQLLEAGGRVAGTVAPETSSIAEIRGVQFAGRAAISEDASARRAYTARFPYAPALRSPLWAFTIDEAKFTENRKLFAQKTIWVRSEEETVA